MDESRTAPDTTQELTPEKEREMIEAFKHEFPVQSRVYVSYPDGPSKRAFITGEPFFVNIDAVKKEMKVMIRFEGDGGMQAPTGRMACSRISRYETPLDSSEETA